MPEKQTITIKRDKVLCLFSGGLDSLGALYLLLKDPAFQNKQIHVHHLVLKNRDDRGIVEKMVCDKIITYFKSNGYKDFHFSECFHDISFMNRHLVEKATLSGFMAANSVLNDISIGSVVMGLNADKARDVENTKKFNKARSLFQTMLPNELKYSTNFIFPTGRLSKLEIWQMLPPELRNMAWFCKKPIYQEKKILTCHKCSSCQDLQRLKRASSQTAWAHPLGMG